MSNDLPRVEPPVLTSTELPARRGDGEELILDSCYSWSRLAVTLLVAILGNAGFWICVTIMPAVQAELQTSRAAVSILYTLTMVGFGTGCLLFGGVADRFGITRLLLFAACLVCLGHGLASLGSAIAVLAILQCLIGLGAAASYAPLIADISLWFYRRRALAISIAAGGNYLAGAIWPLLLRNVLDRHGWRTVYRLIAIASAAMVPLSLLLRRRVPAAAVAHAEALRVSRQEGRRSISPRLLIALLATSAVGCCMAMATPQAHIVSLCADLGHGATVGSTMLSLMLWGGVASRLFFGVLGDRLGGVLSLLIGSTLQCIALSLFLPFAVRRREEAPPIVALYAVCVIFGLSQGGILPSYPVIIRELSPAKGAAGRVGFIASINIASMALGGLVSGAIHDASGGYRAAFLNGLGWNALNIGVAAWLFWRTHSAGPRGVCPCSAPRRPSIVTIHMQASHTTGKGGEAHGIPRRPEASVAGLSFTQP